MLVEKGEGRFVQIRGVSSDLNNVTINGVQMGSPESREWRPPGPARHHLRRRPQSVQVVKTPPPTWTPRASAAPSISRPRCRSTGPTISTATPRRATAMRRRPDPDGLWRLRPLRRRRHCIRQDRRHVRLAARRVVLGSRIRRPRHLPGHLDPACRRSGRHIPADQRQEQLLHHRPQAAERATAPLNGSWTRTPSYFVRGFYGSWDEFQHRNRYEENLTFGTAAAPRVVPPLQPPVRSLPTASSPTSACKMSDKTISAVGGEETRSTA